MNADLRPIAGGPRRAAARSLVRTDLAQSIRWLLVVALALVGAVAQPADAEQIDYARFDHTSTGFPLDGRHQNLRCEQCHINGAFEGTPRECRACHIQGNTRSTMVVPVNHLPLTYWIAPTSGPAMGVKPVQSTDCSNCHTTSSFGGAHYAHTDVMPGTCAGCHNPNGKGIAMGIPQGHIAVNSAGAALGSQPGTSCDECHTTVSFGAQYLIFPSGHIPVGATACTNCHVGTVAPYTPAYTKMNHSGLTSSCAGCHGTGKRFLGTAQTEIGGQPLQAPGAVGTPGAANHIPYGSADCVSCHSASSTSQGGFKITATPSMSATGHAAVNSLTCANCHASGDTWYGVTIVVPPGTVGTSGAANHIALGTGDCKTCHASSFATGGFKITTTPALAAAGHAAVGSVSCASCHGTGSAWYGVPTLVTQLGNHIPIAGATCSACHGSSFVTGGFHINGTPGTTPVLSPANHSAVASLTCSTCHENNATDLGFQGVLTQIYVRPGTVAAGLSPVDAGHATGTLATNDCVQCHGTSPPFAANKPPTNHIPLPTGTTCSGCHSAGYTPTLSKMIHSVVTSETCGACHGSGKGPFAGTGPGTGGQPVQPPGTVGASGAGNHIPVGTSDCVACHASTDTESGTGFKLTTSSLAVVDRAHGGQCADVRHLPRLGRCVVRGDDRGAAGHGGHAGCGQPHCAGHGRLQRLSRHHHCGRSVQDHGHAGAVGGRSRGRGEPEVCDLPLCGRHAGQRGLVRDERAGSAGGGGHVGDGQSHCAGHGRLRHLPRLELRHRRIPYHDDAGAGGHGARGGGLGVVRQLSRHGVGLVRGADAGDAAGQSHSDRQRDVLGLPRLQLRHGRFPHQWHAGHDAGAVGGQPHGGGQLDLLDLP